MRDIKFRVWDNINKKYVNSELYSLKYNGKLFYGNADFTNAPFNTHIEQYTGLTDKNGVEIYEGDRITNGHYTYTIKFGNIGYDGSHNGLTGFYLEEEENVDYNDETFLELNYHFNYKEFEVIGNIHEWLTQYSNGLW